MLYVNPCYMHCRCSNDSRCLNYFEGLSNFFYNDSWDIMFDTSIDFKMPHIQPSITCSNLTIETLEQAVKYVQS